MIRGLVKQCIPQLQRVLHPCWSEMKAQGHFLKGALCINCKAVPAPVFFYKYPTVILLSGQLVADPDILTAMPSKPAHNGTVIKVPVTNTTRSSFTITCAVPGDGKKPTSARKATVWGGWLKYQHCKTQSKVGHCTEPQTLISGAHVRMCHRSQFKDTEISISSRNLSLKEVQLFKELFF